MRLFLGVEINQIVDHIKKVQDKFSQVIEAKFVEKHNLHVTVNYLGDYNPYKAVKKLDNLSYKKFNSNTGGVEVFPNPINPRVLYMSITPKKEFIELNKLTTKILKNKNKQKYHPHITLGRIKKIRDTEKFIKLLNQEFENKHLKINSLNLYTSRLTNNGPIYTIIKEFDLKD